MTIEQLIEGYNKIDALMLQIEALNERIAGLESVNTGLMNDEEVGRYLQLKHRPTIQRIIKQAGGAKIGKKWFISREKLDSYMLQYSGMCRKEYENKAKEYKNKIRAV